MWNVVARLQIDPVIAQFHLGHDDGRGHRSGGRKRRLETRKSAAGADPDYTARIGQESLAVAVVPDQAVGAAVVAPGLVVENVDAVIGARP